MFGVPTALIFFIAAVVGGVTTGVGVCMYFYVEEQKEKYRRINPAPVPVVKMSKQFTTKDFWGLRTLKISPAPSTLVLTDKPCNDEKKNSERKSSIPTRRPSNASTKAFT